MLRNVLRDFRGIQAVRIPVTNTHRSNLHTKVTPLSNTSGGPGIARATSAPVAVAAGVAGSRAIMSGVHQIAVSGFGEGTNDTYDRVRPSYPAAALRYIYSALLSSSSHAARPKEEGEGRGERRGAGLTILEPGSGTGIFSRLLISPPPTPTLTSSASGGENVTYPSFPIKTLVAIEPSEGMRKAWTKGLDEKVPRADQEGKRLITVQGGFDDFSRAGVGEGQVDGVIIAQAWHWCPDYEAALRNIAKFLRPGAPLILIWNLESPNPGWQASVRGAYEPHDLGTPQYYKRLWRSMFETDAYERLFEEKEEWKTVWRIGMTEDQLVDRLFSKSYLTSNHLSGERRDKLDSDLRGIIKGAEHDWVDKDKGIFNFAYDTDVVVLRRNAAANP